MKKKFDYINLCNHQANDLPPSPLFYVIGCNQIGHPLPPSLSDYVINGPPLRHAKIMQLCVLFELAFTFPKNQDGRRQPSCFGQMTKNIHFPFTGSYGN